MLLNEWILVQLDLRPTCPVWMSTVLDHHFGNAQAIHEVVTVWICGGRSASCFGTKSTRMVSGYSAVRKTRWAHLNFFLTQLYLAHDVGSFILVRFRILEVCSFENGVVAGAVCRLELGSRYEEDHASYLVRRLFCLGRSRGAS